MLKQAPSRPVDPNTNAIAHRFSVVVEVLIGLAADVFRQHTATLRIQAGGVEVPVGLVRIPCPQTGHVDGHLPRSGWRRAEG